MKVRVIGPLLMIALGAALALSPASTAFEVGTNQPCLPFGDEVVRVEVPQPCDPCFPNDRGQTVAVVDPCDPCNQPNGGAAGLVDPCQTTTTRVVTTTEATTTTTEATTTTTEATTTTEVPTTSEAPTTTEATTTTTEPLVAAGGAGKPMSGTLARTGTSSVAPMTVLGVVLMIAGAGLFLIGRRRTLAEG